MRGTDEGVTVGDHRVRDIYDALLYTRCCMYYGESFRLRGQFGYHSKRIMQ